MGLNPPKPPPMVRNTFPPPAGTRLEDAMLILNERIKDLENMVDQNYGFMDEFDDSEFDAFTSNLHYKNRDPKFKMVADKYKAAKNAEDRARVRKQIQAANSELGSKYGNQPSLHLSTDRYEYSTTVKEIKPASYTSIRGEVTIEPCGWMLHGVYWNTQPYGDDAEPVFKVPAHAVKDGKITVAI